MKINFETKRLEINLKDVFTIYILAKEYTAGVFFYLEVDIDKESYIRYNKTKGK